MMRSMRQSEWFSGCYISVNELIALTAHFIALVPVTLFSLAGLVATQEHHLVLYLPSAASFASSLM